MQDHQLPPGALSNKTNNTNSTKTTDQLLKALLQLEYHEKIAIENKTTTRQILTILHLLRAVHYLQEPG